MLNLLAVVAQTALLALLAPAVVGYVRLAKAGSRDAGAPACFSPIASCARPSARAW